MPVGVLKNDDQQSSFPIVFCGFEWVPGCFSCLFLLFSLQMMECYMTPYFTSAQVPIDGSRAHSIRNAMNAGPLMDLAFRRPPRLSEPVQRLGERLQYLRCFAFGVLISWCVMWTTWVYGMDGLQITSFVCVPSPCIDLYRNQRPSKESGISEMFRFTIGISSRWLSYEGCARTKKKRESANLMTELPFKRNIRKNIHPESDTMSWGHAMRSSYCILV